eukprot:GHVP01014019.1.p1 GENE.GHVP01014019.1~~GHVP01014019.1.p1  ORF type:complete len:445 (-),score=61.12 GHVP01014019.1:82-1416(-)
MSIQCEIHMEEDENNGKVTAKTSGVVKEDSEEELDSSFHSEVEKTIQKLKNLSLFSVAWWEHRASGAWHTGNLLVLDSKATLAPYMEALVDIPQAAVSILWVNGEESGTFWKLNNGSLKSIGELCSESIITKLDLIRMKQDPLFLPLSHHVAFHNAVLGLVSLHTPCDPNNIELSLKSPPFRWRSMTAPGTETKAPLLSTSTDTASVSRLLSLFGDISGAKQENNFISSTKRKSARKQNNKNETKSSVPKAPTLSSLLFSPKESVPGPHTFTFAPASPLAQYFSLLRAPSRSFLEADYSCHSIIPHKLPKRNNIGLAGGSDDKETLSSQKSKLPKIINPSCSNQEEGIMGNQFCPKEACTTSQQSELPALDMKTRVFGVSFDRSKRNWEASWADTRTGKRVKKCFSEGRWGLQAREKAVAARREAEQLGYVSHGLRNYAGLQQS